MEAPTTLHHRHQPLCSSLHPSSLSSTTASSLFLSNPSPSPSPSSSIRALSSQLPPSSESLQNLQYPELKTPQFFNPLVKVPNFDPPLQDPEPKSPQFSNPSRNFPTFVTATVAASASAFLFLGCCQNRFNKPVMSLSSVVSIEEKLDDDKIDSVEEFLGSKPNHVESVLHLKMKEKIHVVHSFNKTKTNDDEAWLVLKAEVFSCSKNLELIKVGFEKILEKDMDFNKVHEERVLDYLETVDDCNSYLKSIKWAMDRCAREDANIRFICKVVDHIKVLEGDMVGFLKYFKQHESE